MKKTVRGERKLVLLKEHIRILPRENLDAAVGGSLVGGPRSKNDVCTAPK